MKTITVCADIFPPYQYRREDGTDTGLDYDAVIGTLRKTGYNIEFRLGLWDEVIALFESKEADALFQVQDTPERLEKFFLSDKLRDAVTEVVTLNEELSRIRSYNDLSGSRLGVIAGFANGEGIDSLPEDCKRAYDDTPSLLKGLDTGEIDAAVCDQGVKAFVAGDSRYMTIETLTYKRALFVMFHDRTLRDVFNEAFA